jgi:NAD-dependent dihydropyrimidine dehydrogenase PreA subunit
MDHYEALRVVLDAHPAGAPGSDALEEILQLLFPGDEITIALAMSFGLKTADEIMQRVDLPPDEVTRHLSVMADRGVIFSRQTKKGTGYALVPTTSLCERTIQRSNDTPAHERLRTLWKQYRADGMVASVCGDTTPLMRIIPVEAEVVHTPHILPHEVVSELIRSSGAIAVSDCSCRVIEQRCAAPIETCFNFGGMAEFLIDRSLARRVSLEEALAILHETEEAGLIHCADNTTDRPNKICNCCPCCCLFLKGLLELGNPHAVATSSYLAWVDEGKCNGCGVCHEVRCRVGAIAPEGDRVWVDAGKCIGCGQCASACPTGAIELKKRETPAETPPTIRDMAVKVLTEKGRLDAFMSVMMK